MDDGIPIPVRSLLTERIGSVAQLETLLLLHSLAVPGADPAAPHRTPDELGARDAASVANALRIGAPSAAQILDELARAFLVVTMPTPTPALTPAAASAAAPLYRFPIENQALRSAVDQLRAMYAERRVTVVSLIFSRPRPAGPSTMQSFSDAFRLRREKENPADG